MIAQCTCIHYDQDRLHGFGRRVFNASNHGTHANCTVCNAKKTLSSQQVKDSKKDSKKK